MFSHSALTVIELKMRLTLLLAALSIGVCWSAPLSKEGLLLDRKFFGLV
jgi:hypothetical protein